MSKHIFVGQRNNIEYVRRMKDEFSRFVLLIGPEGSGKKLFAEFIAKELNAVFHHSSSDVETVRNVRNTAYKNRQKMVILFSDIQNMSMAAKNSLLKVIEEVPNNVYFIMTSTSDTLPTIKSRALTISMEPYSSEELSKFALLIDDNLSADELDLICQIAMVPGDIEKLIEYDVIEFYNFIEKVINKIHVVSGANSFKIADNISMKNDSNGWEMQLFFKAVMSLYLSKLKETRMLIYSECISITEKYLNELNINGINKSFLFDFWIMDIRKAWRQNVTNS